MLKENDAEIKMQAQVSEHLTYKPFNMFNKDMSTFQKRLQSYEGWPTNKAQTPHTLAECGFYYSGESDKVICYFCGVGAHNWLPEDNPWIEHALFSNKCTYLLVNKAKANQKVILSKKISSQICISNIRITSFVLFL